MDCLSDSAWVVWEESVGAELYVAVATDSQGQTFECNSTDSNTCAMPELHCGHHFTFTLTALDQKCSSAPSNAVVSETGERLTYLMHVNIYIEVAEMYI